MIITIDERTHIHNEYVCDFCECTDVVGGAYVQRQRDYPVKHYLFRYCAKCAISQAQKLASVAHPDYRVAKR